MNTLSLSDLTFMVEMFTGFSIVVGIIIGVFQLSSLRSQQRDAIAINLSQTFYSKDLAESLALLRDVPDGITAAEMREMGHEYVEATIKVITSFETMGLLVFRRIAPLDLVMDMAGGIISVMSRRLHQWQEDTRIEQNQPSWGEWFDWLGEQAQIAKNEKGPAHIEHRNWKP